MTPPSDGSQTDSLPAWYHALRPFRAAFDRGLPALMYHKILRPPRDARARGLFVSPALFRRQMRELRAAGFSSAPPGPGTDGNPDRRILITFDDGFTNVLDHALPALRECGFQAINFLVADLLGRHNAWETAAGERSDPLMEAAQVRDWLAAGQLIGSHSLTHPRLGQLPLADARREIFDSRKKLEDRFGVAIEHFCYPYGNFSPAVRDLVVEAGYATGCSVEVGLNTAATDRFALKRFLVRHHQPGLLALVPFLPSRWL